MPPLDWGQALLLSQGVSPQGATLTCGQAAGLAGSSCVLVLFHKAVTRYIS